ncbi:MAG: glycosyltransferase family 39 protein [Gemmataceae bacterium]|nr:glycosyltransferase family 39 protein [Gemmata sp.]MDW8199214.1 glycosyltransferase family 39 protein [Gemmataceae bacterium]
MVPSVLPTTGRWLGIGPQWTDRLCQRLAGALIVSSVVFHLAYLIADCPLDLSPDEAHYWQWSRHWAWSYYSKGPLVAWLIRGSCEVFGPLSEALVGSPMLAVRLPAVVCHAALLAGWYVLAWSTLRSHAAALATVAMALSLPAVAIGAVIMTIDPPFLACWCWAAVGVWKGLETGRWRWWLLAAVASLFGVLAKYPMVLLPAAVVGYLLVYRRTELKRAGFWLFVAGSVVGLIPIVVWNAAHGWVSFKHVGTQAVGSGTSGIRWLGPLAFVGGQVAFLIGVWFVVWVCAIWRYRRRPEPALGFLWWCSVPVWGVFLVASGKAAGQINWPAAAYITGWVLAVAWIREQCRGAYRGLVLRGVGCGVAAGLGLSLLAHYPAVMRPALVAIAGAPTEQNPTPIRKFDPTARLRGWRTLAAEVDAIRQRLRQETGTEPLLAGTVWNIPGELGVYCRGHPETYSFGLAMADRHSQYDLWRPNPIADAQVFRGRTFVFVGDGLPEEAGVFERIEPPVIVVYREGEVPVARWWVWVGHGFRGFPPKPLYAHSARY